MTLKYFMFALVMQYVSLYIYAILVTIRYLYSSLVTQIYIYFCNSLIQLDIFSCAIINLFSGQPPEYQYVYFLCVSNNSIAPVTIIRFSILNNFCHTHIINTTTKHFNFRSTKCTLFLFIL